MRLGSLCVAVDRTCSNSCLCNVYEESNINTLQHDKFLAVIPVLEISIDQHKDACHYEHHDHVDEEFIRERHRDLCHASIE